MDIATEDQKGAGHAGDGFGSMMRTVPPQETVILRCGSLGSMDGAVDAYRWLALVIKPDAGKSDHQEG